MLMPSYTHIWRTRQAVEKIWKLMLITVASAIVPTYIDAARAIYTVEIVTDCVYSSLIYTLIPSFWYRCKAVVFIEIFRWMCVQLRCLQAGTLRHRRQKTHTHRWDIVVFSKSLHDLHTEIIGCTWVDECNSHRDVANRSLYVRCSCASIISHKHLKGCESHWDKGHTCVAGMLLPSNSDIDETVCAIKI